MSFFRRIIRLTIQYSSRITFGLLALSLAAITFSYAQQSSSTVNVRVSDSANEEPVFQAEVRIVVFGRGVYSHRAFTDGGGRVSFYGVTRGNYQLEVEKHGYETSRQRIDIGYGPNENFMVSLSRQLESKGPQVLGTVSATVPPDARLAYDEGVRELKTKPEESALHFQRAIELYPDYAEAHAMLGLARMRQKQNADAEAALSRAIKIDPKLAVAHTLLGKIYLEDKKFDLAEKLLVRSTQLDSKAWDAPFELARCYFNMGKLEKAVTFARRAHDLPNAASSTHLLLVDIHLKQGNNEAALRELREFERADPASSFMPRVQKMIEKLSKK